MKRKGGIIKFSKCKFKKRGLNKIWQSFNQQFYFKFSGISLHNIEGKFSNPVQPNMAPTNDINKVYRCYITLVTH